jgi:hypothetical protein
VPAGELVGSPQSTWVETSVNLNNELSTATGKSCVGTAVTAHIQYIFSYEDFENVHAGICSASVFMALHRALHGALHSVDKGKGHERLSGCVILRVPGVDIPLMQH